MKRIIEELKSLTVNTIQDFERGHEDRMNELKGNANLAHYGIAEDVCSVIVDLAFLLAEICDIEEAEKEQSK